MTMPSKMNWLNRLFLPAVFLACLQAGCTASREVSDDHAEVYKNGSGIYFILIKKREWKGLWGASGPGGFTTVGFWAKLEGPGPVYKNPEFQDNPSSFSCQGYVNLNLDQKSVEINMTRVSSDEKMFEKPMPHPANGIYSFMTVSQAPEYLK